MAPGVKSKYNKLVKWVKQRIASGELTPGQRLYSENEFAQMFGVSRQTVRQAIGILENEKLVERRRGSGTYLLPTPAPTDAPSKTIGVITTYLDDYIFPSIVRGIERVLSQNGYAMRLAITNNKVENETEALARMLHDAVDGLIVEPTKSAFPNLNREVYAKLTQRGVPCLMINGAYPGLGLACVAPDDLKGGSEAASYLLARGHTKIGGIFKSDDIQGHLRYQGFALALKEKGVALSDDAVLWYVTEDADRLFCEENSAYLLSRIRGCTALLCYNDQIAVRLMEVLRRACILVPRGLSLISFDNSSLAASADVGLTSVAHPKEKLGEAAAQGMLDMLSGLCSSEASFLFKPQIAERQSVLRLE